MGALTTFLREEGERLKAGQPERAAKLHEWQSAIRGLMAQLAGWVRDADPDGLIEIDDAQSQRLLEQGLGLYYAPRLGLRLESRYAWVIPKARNVFAFVPTPDGGDHRADGLVVVTDSRPRDDEVPAAAYNLLWVRGPDGGGWFVRAATDTRAEPLTRERFEAILVDVLR